MSEFKDFYAVLGVSSSAPLEVIRAAYRVMVRLHHPDVNAHLSDQVSMMAQINLAYETLSCSLRRREYDLSLERKRRQTPVKWESWVAHVVGSDRVGVITYDHRGRLRTYA
jgi:curved DNA-binding protein CbpA